ncbi:Carbon monoxide dehydrogenase subunit G [Saccharopolyspora antimicrobica]|uniref:Carbon monoxide dehydrogenase subunit G n=1 Tax=Saccharopolyspora antimicrobica TaxID=455193 RepID=A0A1I5IYH0_9PSEU|nr:SRPBCC family protein [Saccharopolyspora antimicrobica]RKT83780.1 carbon monoxide dehydrogenase subunit G [Saccharopolyspora antimicrobica]SFO65433.1 Carbon monoxide dehydrogenase subunit G [Saccharopolyspora antimicrobica]
MQMQHQFSVPVPVEVAWQALLDPERVAPCMPGATLTKAEGNEFSGSVKVKLGPVTLLYKGTGTFKEIDEAARRVVIDASGKDSRGSGTAAATVAAVLTSEGDTTAVTVDTDLKVTGKPAQLGRGLISEVGGKILNQFAANLAKQLTEEGAPAEAKPAAGSAQPAGAAGESAGGAEAKPEEAEAVAAKPAEAKEEKASSAAGAAKPSWRVTPAGGQGEPASPAKAEPSRREAAAAGGGAASDDAIDLLGTAGAPVLKRLAPLAVAVVVLGIVFRLIRRRRRRRA